MSRRQLRHDVRRVAQDLDELTHDARHLARDFAEVTVDVGSGDTAEHLADGWRDLAVDADQVLADVAHTGEDLTRLALDSAADLVDQGEKVSGELVAAEFLGVQTAVELLGALVEAGSSLSRVTGEFLRRDFQLRAEWLGRVTKATSARELVEVQREHTRELLRNSVRCAVGLGALQSRLALESIDAIVSHAQPLSKIVRTDWQNADAGD